MGNYIQKVITVLAIIPYISKWFNLNKQQKINKELNIKREKNDFVEWGQFIELDNYNRDKMS
tara:strand:- start:6841 stop:7026 length:186 start_codon:yes stop_codon:yes gene_type:complete